MKKAKVLIPAIAVLALSAASAVTGTVAWFTASRNVSMSSGNITVVNTEASLNYNILDTTNKGCNVTDSEPNKDSVTFLPLRDGSVDVPNSTVYKVNMDQAGKVPANPTDRTYTAIDETLTDSSDSTGAPVYRAAFYQIKFTLSANTPKNAKYGLYFNRALSEADNKKDSGTDSNIKNALRVGFKDGEEWTVWAPFNPLTVSDHYVSNATATPTSTAYVADNIATTVPENDDTSHASYLAPLTGESSLTNTTTVDVWTWFEGEDADCDEKLISDAIWSLKLHFSLIAPAASK